MNIGIAVQKVRKVFRPRFEPAAYRIAVKSATYSLTV